MISLFLATLLLMQQDQIPRQPKKDDRGLLKIDPVFNPLREHAGGDARDLGLQLLGYDWRSE